MLCGICEICGTNKTMFAGVEKSGGCVPCKKSGGDIQNFLSNLPGLPWAKYPGEKHIPGYNYCGPGTRLDIRLDENDKPKLGEEPINKTDSICLPHDIAYRNCKDDLLCKQESDRIMLRELNAIKDSGIRERLVRNLLVKAPINTKLKLGLGLDPENDREKLALKLHKPFRKPAVLLKVKVFAKDDIWSADLVEMPKENLGRLGIYKYILTVIDLYTRYAFAIPLKNKTGSTTREAFEQIFKTSGRMPKRLWCDRGKEFYNKIMKDFLNENNIELYSTFNEGKAVVVERLNRTLKNMMWKHFTIKGKQKWMKILPVIVNQYNNKIHSSIKITPAEASENPEKIKEVIEKNNYENEDKMTKRQNKPKYKVGDKVIIFKYKYKFTNGFVAKWTEEVFIVSEIVKTSPTTYKIKDLEGEEIEGRFYANELQKVDS
jgi:transposase InsO family protein